MTSRSKSDGKTDGGTYVRPQRLDAYVSIDACLNSGACACSSSFAIVNVMLDQRELGQIAAGNSRRRLKVRDSSEAYIANNSISYDTYILRHNTR